jgi:5-methyltetrahydrofolate--homocysteine methyltransferase
MISPAMFGRFVEPKMRMEARVFSGRLAYHMDGPGQRPHLPELLAMQGLRAIQWVPGAGNPGTLSPRWDELYARITGAGKKVCLGGVPFDPEGIRRLLAKFPPGSFFIPLTLSGRREAEELLELAEQKW